MPRHATGRRLKADPKATICVLKVALFGDRTIWRTIAIRSDQTLDDMHAVIFEAFDRFDEHLYSFWFSPRGATGPNATRDGVEYTSPVEIGEHHGWGEREFYDASKTRLSALKLRPGQKFSYLFDFGDSWWHELAVEATDGKPGYGRVYPFVMEKHGVSSQQYPDPVE